MRRHLALAGLAACLLGGILLLAMGQQVESRFEGRLFHVPTRVYSRPLLLAPGVDVERLGLVEHLGRLGYRRVKSARVGAGEYAVHRGEIWIGRRQVPEFGDELAAGRLRVRLDSRGRVAHLEGPKGRPLRSARIEPEPLGAFYGDDWVERAPLPLEAFPPHLIDALLAIEDQRFYEHSGLDLRRIAGALVANVRARSLVQGGSTLSQQLVKNFYLSPDRSLWRKLREAPMALLLELRHEKDEILEAYLNEIYLGQRGPVAIQGVGAGARHYFGKEAADLDLAESALLVGLIRGPGVYSPHHRPEAAQARRDRVLGILLEQERISEEQHAQAVARPLGVRPAPTHEDPAPYFLAYVRGQLEERHDAVLEEDGYSVVTTLDPRLQRLAQDAVRKGLASLEERVPKLKAPPEPAPAAEVEEETGAEVGAESAAPSPVQAALVALDPRDGAILAMVGGRDFRATQFNRAVQARRQPGSAFKPIVALAGLSRDGKAEAEPAFTLATLFEDEPLRVPVPDGEWSPVNHGGEFLGPVTLREALELSLNVPIARAGLELGPKRVIATARRLGIQSPLEAVPSLVLGASEVTLLELTGAYGVFAARGRRATPHGLRAVFDAEGTLLEETQLTTREIFPADEIHLVTSALLGAVERGTAASLPALGYQGPVAGKTGTTNDYRDAWFLGYTPEIVVGVWVGFDDNRPVGVTGAVGALPIFARFLVAALGPAGGADFERPDGLERVSVNAQRGMRAGWGCPGEPELFLEGTAPTESCGYRSPFGFLRDRFGWLRGRGRPPPQQEDWREQRRERRRERQRERRR